jgi:hypothetical protein
MCAFSTPYLAAKKTLYWSNKTYLLGRALVLGMTNGDMDIAFSMPKGRLNPKTPSIDSLTESIRLDQTWEARRKNGTPDVEAFSFDITATP